MAEDVKKFNLRSRTDVERFENMLRRYLKDRTGLSMEEHISLCHVYDALQSQENGSKIFYSLLDIDINFALLMCDICEAGNMWNRMFSGNKCSEGSVLESSDLFFGKMEIHRCLSSFILRYRAIWDKIMGLLIMLFAPESYRDFERADSRKKEFGKIIKKTSQISHEELQYINELLTNFDNEFRTSEAHGTGRLRKWSFMMESMGDNPTCKLYDYWNVVNSTKIALNKLICEHNKK